MGPGRHAGRREGRRFPGHQGLMVSVGRGRGHGEAVGDAGLQGGSRQHDEAARVAKVANHPRARHSRSQGDRRLGRVRRHGRREGHRDRCVDGDTAGSVRRLQHADHRSGSGGDRPVVVDRVHHSARIADAAGEGERVGRARREDRPGWSSVKPVSPESQTIRQGASGLGIERGLEVAGLDRPVHREPPLDRSGDHRSVELNGDRRVGGHANRSAVGTSWMI